MAVSDELSDCKIPDSFSRYTATSVVCRPLSAIAPTPPGKAHIAHKDKLQMRYLEIRRHSRRIQPNEHLSQEGVDLARRIGKEAGPFDLVVSSPELRASETAVAMGFAVEDTYQPVELTKAEKSTLNDLLNPPEIGLGERSRRLKSGDLPLRFS